MTPPVAIRPIVRYGTGTGGSQTDQDLVAVEAPLTVRVQAPTGAPVSLGLFMRTPGHDEELALGALLAEGVIRHRAQVRQVEVRPGVVERGRDEPDSGDEVIVTVTAEASLAAIAGRGSTATSACGLCGRLEVTTLDTSSALAAGVGTPMVSAATLVRIPEQLRQAQTAFAETGGLHAAGLCDADGTLTLVREDVGRHNAVDKVAGALLEQGRLPAQSSILVVSGRVAYEIVQKAARSGVPVILAVGAPTDLAVDAARAAGITLVGFARDSRFNVYTWPGRVGDIPHMAG
jgi:FdhD protein